LFAIKNYHLMMSEAAKAKFTALASPPPKKKKKQNKTKSAARL
jgi:hypothetical protein